MPDIQAIALVAAEEERAILDNRRADRGAELVQLQRRLGVSK